MHLVTRIKAFPDMLPSAAPLMMHRLLHCLPPALRTPDNLALIRIYFLIPQPSVRHFVLALLARITDDDYTACPFSDLAQAEYLLKQYAQLPTGDMREKVLALVRQVCAANRGDKGEAYEALR